MVGRFAAYASKKLPAITAFLKKDLKNNSTVPLGILFIIQMDRK
jgi:hypothetical protein